MTRKLLFAMIVAVLLTACDRAPQPPLAFGAAAWAGYAPVYLAQELGYFQGANLRLDSYDSPAVTEEAMRGRKVHLAAMTLDRALLLHRDIPDLKIILVFDVESVHSPESARTAPVSRVDVLVTRDQTIGEYHGELQQLLQGWQRAVEFARANPDKAAQIMARHQHVTPAQFNVQLQGVELYDRRQNLLAMMGEPAPIGARIEAAQRALLGQGKLSVGADPSMLIDTTLLAELPK